MKNSLVEKYSPIAQMIAKTFNHDCEVVIHDLSVPQNSVVYTINNHVTGRQVGQSFDHLVKDVLLSQNFENDCSANYYFHTPDGRLIKSSTALLRDDDHKVIGALCVNMDTTKIQSAADLLLSFMPTTYSGPALREDCYDGHISDIAEDLIDKILSAKNTEKLRRDEKVELIGFMEQKGIFLIKGAIDKVAEKMGISKVTVYSYIDEIKEKENRPSPDVK